MSAPSRSWLFSVLTFVAFHSIRVQAQTCYWPDGTIAKNTVACDPDKEHSMCCWDNGRGACSSNGLCLWLSDWSLDRVACTDKTWTNSACRNICKNSPSSEHADVTSRVCSDKSTIWCCTHDDDCCQSGTGEVVSSDLINSQNGFGDIYMPRERGATSGSTTVTVTQSIVGGTTCAVPGATSAASSLQTCSGCHDVAIGVGLGVPLGIALLTIAALAGFMFRKRSQSVAPSHYSEPMAQSPPTMPYSGTPSTYIGGGQGYAHPPPHHEEPQYVSEMPATSARSDADEAAKRTPWASS